MDIDMMLNPLLQRSTILLFEQPASLIGIAIMSLVNSNLAILDNGD